MGLFNDNVGSKRTNWTFTYLAKDLIKSASHLYEQYHSKEESARNRMADLMKDMSVYNTDRRVEDCKRDIISFGTLKEQCAVFLHEFTRNKDKEYSLGLGDVTFFELAK